LSPLPHLRRLLLEIEDVALRGGGRQQVERAPVVLVLRFELRPFLLETVETFQQFLPPLEPADRQFRQRRKLGHPVVRLVGVRVDHERIVDRTQPAGELALTVLDEARDVVDQLGTHRDERRQRAAAAAEPRDHGAHRRPLRPPVDAAGRLRSRQQEVGRGRVVGIAVRHRPHQAELVGLSRQKREVLGNLDAGDVGADRPELAAVFRRSVGLQIPGVLVRGTAPHEKEDAGLGASETLAEPRDRRGRPAAFDEVGKRHPQETEASQAQEVAPAQVACAEAVEVRHERPSPSPLPRVPISNAFK